MDVAAPDDALGRRGALRRRLLLLPWMVLVVAAGLGSRRYGGWLPAFVAAYAGDTLWAAMAYLVVAWVWPRGGVLPVALMALAVSFLDEISQLWRAPWLEVLRRTWLGAIVLGRGFLYSDLVCYVAGVTLAALGDCMLRMKGPRRISDTPGPDVGSP